MGILDVPVRKIGHDVTGLGDGRKTIVTPGTRLPLVTVPTPAKQVVITALEVNVGTVVIGAATVVASVATRRGTPLGPGDTFILDVDDLAEVFLDAVNAGDGICFIYTI